jgi:hypothetical protein
MLIEAARIADSLGAPKEYTVKLFTDGLALIRGTGEKPAATAASGNDPFRYTGY